jgi:hypothetical protein
VLLLLLLLLLRVGCCWGAAVRVANKGGERKRSRRRLRFGWGKCCAALCMPDQCRMASVVRQSLS